MRSVKPHTMGCDTLSMNYSLEATYYRTALLLGLVAGGLVQDWAEEIIEQDPGAASGCVRSRLRSGDRLERVAPCLVASGART